MFVAQAGVNRRVPWTLPCTLLAVLGGCYALPVALDDEWPCTSDSDCVDGYTCREEVCVPRASIECTTNDDCRPSERCDPSTKTCILLDDACASDEACAPWVCELNSNRCVECTSTANCSDSLICDLASFTCVACTANTDCDDGLFCNGKETCDGAGVCVSKGDPCPNTECNHCDEAGDSCFDPRGTACSDDGLFCNGQETCDGAGACVSKGDPCPGPDGDIDCAESCDESTDGCWASDPDGQPCAVGLCQAGSCVAECSAPASCTEGCNDIVNGTSSHDFTFDVPAKLCINEGADWTGGVTFDKDGTLEVCGRAAPSWINFNGNIRALNVRVTGTLEIVVTPSSLVENAGLVLVSGTLEVNAGYTWTNHGRIEVADALTINGGGLLNLDSDSLLMVSGRFDNNGTVDGIGAACGAIQIPGGIVYNNRVIQNNADVCPLTTNSGTGPDIPPCSCSPTLPCGL